MKSKKLTKIISLVVALSMVFSLTAFAAQNDKNNTKGSDAQELMIKSGVIKGNGNGDYFWKDYVKRGDITLMIVRAFHLNMINKGNFEDVKDTDYYYNAIATVKAHGIAKGDGKNYNPKKYVTIGEAILLIERSVKVANNNVVVNRDVDLDKLYDENAKVHKDYDKYATRDDIAYMLYLVFSSDVIDNDKDDEEKETGLIEYEIEAGDDFVTFDKEDFEDVFEDLVDEEDKDEDLSYVEFNLPIDHATLYYKYDAKDSTNDGVEENENYYVNKRDGRFIADVSFVPNEDHTGTFEIEYTAFNDSNEDLYEGLIKITVLSDGDYDLDTINYNIAENKTKTFNDRDFLNVFNDSTDNEKIDFIEFKLPEATIGTLYFNVDSDGEFELSEKVVADKEFELSEIDEIIFVPANNFVGNAVIEYTTVDEDDDSYTGIVEIKVAEDYLIDKIELETDNDYENGFVFNLEDELEDLDDGYNFEKVKFTSLTALENGKLSIIEDDNNNVSVVKNKYYDVSYLDELNFIAGKTFAGTITIEYIAVDDNSNVFHGVIEIVVTN